jgi:hypothetical protein
MNHGSHSSSPGTTAFAPVSLEFDEPAAKRAAVPKPGEACPDCGSKTPWGGQTWCPDCGYYPRLNTRLAPEVSSPPAENPQPAGLLAATPQWAWALGGGVLAIAALSAVVGQSLPEEGSARMWWSLGQVAVCVIALGVAHGSAFVKALAFSTKFGPFDFLMKPIGIWQPALRELPEGAWRLWCGSWGLAGIASALVLVGGLRYSALFDDWGFKQRANKNLVHAVTEQARQKREGGADSLQGALDEFTGKEDEEKKKQALAKLLAADCIVVGYAKAGQDDFAALVLATLVDGKLRCVARISARDIPQEARAEIGPRLAGLERKDPFVETTQTATWLEPTLMCRLRFKKWGTGDEMVDPQFESLLADAPLAESGR